KMLNRTIVLVNVQHSRLESCRKFPFNFYYNVDEIMKMFPNVKFITQQDFLNWTRERDNRPTATHRYIKTDRNLRSNLLELRRECLNQFDFKFNHNDDLMINKTTIKLGSKGSWKEINNNKLLIKTLTRLLDLDDEVLLIRHQIPSPLFPSMGEVINLPYANHLIEAANNATNQLGPFIAIHWRMETGEPEMMPICVKSLIKYVNKLQAEIGIYNIYFATDYPL
ncbi:9123_t:CDS:1, partial [Funneliformis caledonium]